MRSTMEYKEMLEKAKKEMPASVIEKERFEIPNVIGHVEGNKTVISNFTQIADTLGRPADHLLKYILKELATPGDFRKQAVIMGRKVAASMVNDKIRKYADEYVLCYECGKPDTKIVKEREINYLVCTACGAKHPVKA